MSGDDDDTAYPVKGDEESDSDYDTRLTTWQAKRDDNSKIVVVVHAPDEGDTVGAVLSGVTVTGGYGVSGAGVYALSRSDVTITHCTFTNNTASNGGGAIYTSTTTTTIISHCAFNNNTTTGYSGGGAIYARSSSISHCTFTNNSANDGGAIYGDATISHCTFTNNSANEGGAIYARSSSISHCTFTNNTATSGAAIYDASSSLSVSHCTFTNNTALNGGGAIYTDSSTTITHCTFTNNTASVYYGGAISAGSNTTSLSVSHCTFTGNTAAGTSSYSDYLGGGLGGAIYVRSSYSSSISHCTFYNNSATQYGGGVYAFWNTAIRNCIFWGNVADEAGGTDGDQIYNAGSGAFIVSHCLIQGGASALYRSTRANPYYAANILSADPLFVSTTAGAIDLRLRVGSPAIDVGDNDVIDGADGTWAPADAEDEDGASGADGIDDDGDIAADLNGNLRLVNNIVDLGPYEYAATPTKSTLANTIGKAVSSKKPEGISHIDHSHGAGGGGADVSALQDKITALEGEIATLKAGKEDKGHTHTALHTHPNTGIQPELSVAQRHTHANAVQISPNPARDIVNIVANQGFIYTILNASGLQVRMGSVQMGVNTLDIKALATGMYLFVFQNEDTTEMHRVVVK